jgi:hypothetical protein
MILESAMRSTPPAANKALYAHTRSSLRTRSTLASFALYEAEKCRWIGANQGATPEQYAAAVSAIAKACGV